MSFNSSIEVKNLKEDLRLLNQLNPKLRREIGREFRRLAAPAVKEATNDRQKGSDIKGFQHRGRTGVFSWKALATRIDTRKARKRNLNKGVQFESLGVIKIQTKDASSAIMDMSGRRGVVRTSGQSREYSGRPFGHKLNGQGGYMVRKLNEVYGPASRFMYPGVGRGFNETENEFRDLVQRVEREVTRELGADYFGIGQTRRGR